MLEEATALHKPDAITFEEAAAIPETWFTAYQALFFVAGLEKGQDVLIHAGASGVGIAAIQLAKNAGAYVMQKMYWDCILICIYYVFYSKRIFITAGSDDKVAFCEKLGATKGINYKKQDWAEEVKNEDKTR